MDIITNDNQTLRDIAVKHYGNAEATGEILALNPEIRNDPAALARLGIDALDGAFYLDVALLAGQKLAIGTESGFRKNDIVKTLKNKEINTYDSDD